ncbi:hypothetical protein CHL78_006480 [Romboutsia weinsteinii]|uniref:Uncharacterized protein n=1 Tax=Romboutsia weinsteinii TaxID=2020949 RepID=A0A371J641_9FIRM|nr:hypothetical protein CHL78_006480 [Romboutsia weinsteinii]
MRAKIDLLKYPICIAILTILSLIIPKIYDIAPHLLYFVMISPLLTWIVIPYCFIMQGRISALNNYKFVFPLSLCLLSIFLFEIITILRGITLLSDIIYLGNFILIIFYILSYITGYEIGKNKDNNL